MARDADRRLTVESLAALDLLTGASPAQLADLANRLVPARYAPGEVLFAEGDPGTTFVVVLEGNATVTRATGYPARVGEGGPGAIFGELSALTGQPRRATVRAETEVYAAVGDGTAFAALLDVDGAASRLGEVAARRLAELAHTLPIRLADGTDLVMRPLLARDRTGFETALREQPREWMHHRFFSGMKATPTLIDYLVQVDYVHHFAWLVAREDPPEGAGVARYIRLRDDETTAEIAFEVAEAWQGRGIATLLLGALGVTAKVAGVEQFRAEVLYANLPMRAVFAKVGVQWHHAETGVAETRFPTAHAAALVAESRRDEIERAVLEIVTGAGLALGHPTH